jgi:diacylglycerol cholinephosphotransferase
MSYIIFCIHRSYTFTISHTLYYLLLTNGNCGNFFPFISQGTSVLSPGLHIGLIIILAIMIYKKSATNMFEKHPCLYTLMFGCVFAKVAQKLVVRNSFIKDS